MRPPRFWTNPPNAPGWQAHVLAPLAFIYAKGTARRVAQTPSHRAACPVICIGNINAGGTGKTPTVIALIEKLANKAVHVVSRGYGGSAQGPMLVDERLHKADEVGDEPLLISAFAPTWVAKDRAAGVRAAEKQGAEIILLDDGFQNPAVAKSLSIVVVDATVGFGNQRVLPAGPLREPVHVGLNRADLLLSIGNPAAQQAFQPRTDVPRVSAHLETLQTGMEWDGLKVLAFAGIGRPEKFFETLRAEGADILRTVALDDHQPLSEALMARLENDASRTGAQLVTTEKDAVRLPKAFRAKVLTLPVRLRLDEASALDKALQSLGAPKP